jgi:hypothetical protein
VDLSLKGWTGLLDERRGGLQICRSAVARQIDILLALDQMVLSGKFNDQSAPVTMPLSSSRMCVQRNCNGKRRRQLVAVRLSEWTVMGGTVMGGQRQSSSIRQQREMARKLKAAEKRAKRQNRTTEKPKDETEGRRQPTEG